MGRSKVSFLKLITCSGDAGQPASSDEDRTTPSPPESKASSDKRRWSFRKRSGRHRVLSNNVMSDPVSIGYNKESQETAVESFHWPKNPSVTERALIEEPTLPSCTVNSGLVDLQVSVTNTASTHHQAKDSVAVVIQAAIRGYLARRELRNINNIVKLQAVVRGHLVRRQAIGTLRCIQAIIKLQALVRARQAHQYVKDSAAKDDENFKTDTKISTHLGKPNKPCSSTEKLLSNRFAYQLMEFAPKTIHIPIKCDPSRSDSAWKWLERWMVVTSSDERRQREQNLNQGYHENEESTKSSANGVSKERQQLEENHNQGYHENEENTKQQEENHNQGYHENEESIKSSANEISKERQQLEENHNQGYHENEENTKQYEENHNQCYHENEKNTKLSTAGVPNGVPVAVVSISSDLKSAPGELALLTKGQQEVTRNSALEFQSGVSIPYSSFTSLAKNDQDQSYPAVEALGSPADNNCYIERVTEKALECLSGQIPMQPNATAESTHVVISDKLESDEDSKPTTKGASSETPESEGKKIIFGSRKPSNPVFAAVQSKFEELISTNSVGKWILPAYQGTLTELKPISLNPWEHSLTKTKDLSNVDNLLAHDPRIQIATSECGTEISISSTLDSPDISEASGVIVLEIGSLGEGNYILRDGADNDPNLINTNIGTKTSSKDSQIPEPQRLVETDGDITNSILVAEAPPLTHQVEEPIASDKQSHMEISVDPNDYRSSPEGTPRSHTTVLELHGTSSSEVSVYAKKGKKDDNMPSQNQRPQVVGKRSPSTPNNCSGGRSGTGNLPEDLKSGKRRNSFGMAKPDHEPRIGSSNSLPSYMQATESARAKALASISPMLSPDMHDKDNYLKKRHSLPITNGKQGLSLCMQRSASQAQPTKSGNDTHSPHNSAERRWQR